MPIYTTENSQANFCSYCMSKVQPGEVCKNCSLKQGSYVPSPHHIPPGTVLMDRYLIGRVLGEGGFGITYIGCDLRLESKVAIKEYFPVDQVSRYADSSLTVVTRAGRSQDSYSQGIRRFLKEARSLARMEKQTAVVAAKDFFEANNTAYIVMEYIQGTDLKALVAQRGGRISAQELFPMIEPLFAALDAVHQTGLIHRDISPDNIMLEKGKVRLLDFGCARESIKGTETMTVALKQGYAPVEQYQRKGQGPWTDVYALAAVIYFCLTGKVPPASLDRILEDELVPPRQLGANITAEQEAALMKALSISGKRRYQSVATFYEGLYHSVPDQPDPPVPDPPIPDPPIPDPPIPDPPIPDPPVPKLRRNKAAIGAVAAVLVLIAVLVWIGVDRSKEDPNPSGPVTISQSNQTEPPEVTQGNAEVADAVVSDAHSFLNALEDSSIRAITIAPDSFVALYEETAVNLTKPLYIPNGAYLYMAGLMTVSPGGQVEIASGGQLDLELGFLYTMGGGSVTVKNGGSFGAWQCFAEQEGALVFEDDADVNVFGIGGASEVLSNQSVYHVLPSDRVFADGARVSTMAELRQAIDSGASSMIIPSGSEIVVTEWIDISVPLLIEEDATMVLEQESRFNLADTVLVNRGSIVCNENQPDFFYCYGEYSVYNYGTITSDLQLRDEYAGCFLNLGTVNCTTAAVFSHLFVNLGTVNCYGGDGRYFDFQGETTLNYGVWNIETPTNRTGSTNVEFVNYWFLNCGDISIGANAQLTNERMLWNNSGRIVVSDSGALNNLGVLISDREGGSIHLANEDSLRGWGLLTYRDGILNEDWGGGNRLLYHSEDSSYLYASDLNQVSRAFMGNRMTYVEGDLELSGDWTITAPVVVWGSVTVDGSLTVDGSNGGFLICNEVNASKLHVIHDGTLFAETECNISEGLYLEEGVNRLYLGREESRIQGELRIQSDSEMTAIGSVYLNDAEVSLEENGSLVFSGNAEVANCGITVSQGSNVSIRFCDFTLKNSDLINYGFIENPANHWQRNVTLDGRIENHGHMDFGTGANVFIGGTLYNSGKLYLINSWDGGLILTGKLQNNGSVYYIVEEGMSLDIVTQGGQYSGNAPIAYQP